jgi:hypothetical protein
MTPLQPNFETDDLGDCNITSPLRGIFMDASFRLFRTDIDELRAGRQHPHLPKENLLVSGNNQDSRQQRQRGRTQIAAAGRQFVCAV